MQFAPQAKNKLQTHIDTKRANLLLGWKNFKR